MTKDDAEKTYDVRQGMIWARTIAGALVTATVIIGLFYGALKLSEYLAGR